MEDSPGPGPAPPLKDTLGGSYLGKAQLRLAALDFYNQREGYSDVVREAQECVELALKALLRHIGIEPPKQHDVGGLVVASRDLLPATVRDSAERLAAISKWLRKEREFAFYGDEDFVPTDEYSAEDARRAIDDAAFVVAAASAVLRAGPPRVQGKPAVDRGIHEGS